MSATTHTERLPEPIAYVAPLATSDGPIAGAYLVAVTSWLPGNEALLEEVAVSAAGFISHDAPLQTRAIVRARLGRTPSDFPAAVFGADAINTFPWNVEPSAAFIAAFDRVHEADGDCFVFSAHCLILRSGKTPRDGGDWLPNGADYWRQRPATLLLDLDGLYRNRAVAGLRLILGDLIPTSAVLPHERAILDERAFKWTPRGFLSLTQTRDAFQDERAAAFSRLGDSHCRSAIHHGRWHLVEEAIRRRARAAGRSALAEFSESRQRNLALVLPEIVARELATFEDALLAAPPRPLRDYADDFQGFRSGVLRLLAGGLNAAMTEDLLDDPKWRRSRSEAPLQEELAEDASLPATADPTGDEILESAFGRTLLTRARLTPMEKKVLVGVATMTKGDTLAAWAGRNGMSPTTASVHKRNAKLKLEAAKKLS